MGHELGHVYDLLSGMPASHFQTKEVTINFGFATSVTKTISNSEINAMYWENILRNQGGLPLRIHYASPDRGLFYNNNDAVINGKSISDLDGSNTYNLK